MKTEIARKSVTFGSLNDGAVFIRVTCPNRVVLLKVQTGMKFDQHHVGAVNLSTGGAFTVKPDEMVHELRPIKGGVLDLEYVT